MRTGARGSSTEWTSAGARSTCWACAGTSRTCFFATLCAAESGLRAQVERLAARQREEAVPRERVALAAVLHAGPGERRVEVVAAVHEEGDGLDPSPDAQGALLVARPDGGGEAVRAVVHQPHRLVVVRHLGDA